MHIDAGVPLRRDPQAQRPRRGEAIEDPPAPREERVREEDADVSRDRHGGIVEREGGPGAGPAAHLDVRDVEVHASLADRPRGEIEVLGTRNARVVHDAANAEPAKGIARRSRP